MKLWNLRKDGIEIRKNIRIKLKLKEKLNKKLDKINWSLIFERAKRREEKRKGEEEEEEEEEKKKRRDDEGEEISGMELYGILKFCMDFHEIVWISMEL